MNSVSRFQKKIQTKVSMLESNKMVMNYIKMSASFFVFVEQFYAKIKLSNSMSQQQTLILQSSKKSKNLLIKSLGTQQY